MPAATRASGPWLSLLRLAVAALTLAAVPAGPASPQPAEYEVKAEFLERFTRFVEWPSGSSATDPDTPFVIGVLGRDPFGSLLDDLASSRKIKGKPVRVRRLTRAEEAGACDLLFIASSEEPRLRGVLSVTGDRPILTVADTPGFAEAGVLINLFAEGERVGFEVNEPAVRRSGLRVSSRLLRLARLVEGPRP